MSRVPVAMFGVACAVIFLAHGRQDQTMPIDATSRTFLSKLKALEYDVTYREYEGRHTSSVFFGCLSLPRFSDAWCERKGSRARRDGSRGER